MRCFSMKPAWFLFAALALPLAAHHSFNAEYDDSKPVSVTGVVVYLMLYHM